MWSPGSRPEMIVASTGDKLDIGKHFKTVETIRQKLPLKGSKQINHNHFVFPGTGCVRPCSPANGFSKLVRLAKQTSNVFQHPKRVNHIISFSTMDTIHWEKGIRRTRAGQEDTVKWCQKVFHAFCSKWRLSYGFLQFWAEVRWGAIQGQDLAESWTFFSFGAVFNSIQ